MELLIGSNTLKLIGILGFLPNEKIAISMLLSIAENKSKVHSENWHITVNWYSDYMEEKRGIPLTSLNT